MFNFLKYVIFALGLVAAYVLVEHFFVNRSEVEQTISDSVNQAENAVMSETQEISDNIRNEYVEPLEEEVKNTAQNME